MNRLHPSGPSFCGACVVEAGGRVGVIGVGLGVTAAAVAATGEYCVAVGAYGCVGT